MKLELLRLFELPAFSRTLRERAFQVLPGLLAASCVAFVGFATVGLLFTYANRGASAVWVSAMLLTMAGSTMLLVKGRPVAASVVFLVGLWLVVTTTIATSGGVRSSLFFVFVFLVVIAGLLLGHAGLWIANAAAVVTGGVLYALHVSGDLLPLVFPSPPGAVLTNFALVLVIMTVTVHLTETSIANGLARARQEQDRFQAIFDAMNDGVAIHHVETNEVLDVNQAMCALWGLEPEEFKALSAEAYAAGAEPFSPAEFRQRMTGAAHGGPQRFEWQARSSSGHLFWTEVNIRRVTVGACDRLLVVVRDIDERKRTEAQLLQAQKMEAIGRLAGGVAHDFNNLLTGIIGWTEVALARLPQDTPSRTALNEVIDAALRGSELNNQLLIFSRRSPAQVKPVELGSVLGRLARMLRRMIGEQISIHTQVDPAVGYINVDPAQLEQALVNLAVNARDAMPQGGKLTFRATVLSPQESPSASSVPGGRARSWIRLTVSDSGTGMDENTRCHIYEPFFTTKEEGKGTGLGLAMVHAFVTQSGGVIRCASEPGQGTSFEIDLPSADSQPHEDHAVSAAPPICAGGNETILLVEDEELVRSLVGQFLKELGYNVLMAEHPDQALRYEGEYGRNIDMVITDVVMPGMGGPQLARRLTASRPGIKVLFVSGYQKELFLGQDALDNQAELLQKPFPLNVLAEKIRQLLGSPL